MNAWIEQIFKSNQAKMGGIVRRNISSVDHYASRAELLRAAKRKGFMVMTNGDQYLILGKSHFKVVLGP